MNFKLIDKDVLPTRIGLFWLSILTGYIPFLIAEGWIFIILWCLFPQLFAGHIYRKISHEYFESVPSLPIPPCRGIFLEKALAIANNQDCNSPTTGSGYGRDVLERAKRF